MKKLGTRWINKKNFSRLGVATATLLVLTQLISICVTGFVLKGYSGNTIGVVLDAISLLFYFIVLNNYRLSEDNLYQGYFATLLILISDYIFPLILNLIRSTLSLNILFLSLPIIALVVYFIFLTIENKKRDAKTCNILKIIGIVTAIISIIPGIYDLYNMNVAYFGIFKSGQFVFGDVAVYVANLFNAVARTILLPLIFAFYPFVLYKERYL